VTAVDPAAATLAVARAKPGAERVRWVHGYATDLPPLQVDLVTMTANVAQVFLTDAEWDSTLRVAYAALRPGGRLAFETRDPAARAWLEWNRERSYKRTVVPGVGGVQAWIELLEARGDLVSFRSTVVFESDGVVLTSDSTLRFRHRDEVTASLGTAGYVVDEVRQAPDRPGRELVFIARRADVGSTGTSGSRRRSTLHPGPNGRCA
jgi:SAM-dependent methyltransferase